MITVSICCITYNHHNYISKTIDGFLNQRTNFAYEIIIHDDASTDNTPNIIRKYKKLYPSKINAIFQKTNQYSKGIRPFPNYVWPIARGKYVALCEGDDYWTDPYKLQKQVEIMENNENIGLVHTDVDYKYLDGTIIKNINKKNFNYCLIHSLDNISDYIYGGEYSIRTLSVCFRRNLLENVLKKNKEMYNSTFLMGDTILWLELSKITEFYYINFSTGVYNVLAESATHSKNCLSIIRFYKSMYQFAEHYAIKYGFGEDKCSKLKRIYYDQLISQSFYQRDENLLKLTIIEFGTTTKKTFSSILLQLGIKHMWIYSVIKYFHIYLRIVRKFNKILFFYRLKLITDLTN